MKFFATSVIRQLDKLTVENEPVASIDLMERAAEAIFKEFIEFVPLTSPVCVLAGQGNNGGDALALSRMLLKADYDVKTYLIHQGDFSPDCEKNRERLLYEFPGSLKTYNHEFLVPVISENTVIVDGLFGSGLSRAVTGIFADVIKWMNESGNVIVAIDIPSGLQGEENRYSDNSVVVKADVTLTLQFPKLSFLFAENEAYVGEWKALDIGLLPNAIEETHSNLFFLEKDDISQLLKPRSKFAHKGTCGHSLIFAGSKGMAGASVLSSKAALRSGAGLVTVHGPGCNRVVVQISIPEVIFQSDINEDYISEFQDLGKYDVVAIGPGMGLNDKTALFVRSLIEKLNKPCVIDADALNIIAKDSELLDLLPERSILTPHPKEFERIFGESYTSFERMIKAQEAAQRYNIIIVLKGAYTLIAMPDATLYFNSTGNSGMATAGAGDVLTGIITGLLAQGYLPENAAKIGVFLHGLAGDFALKEQSYESIIAEDLISKIGAAFVALNT